MFNVYTSSCLLYTSILEKQEALTIHKKKCQSLNNYNFILNLMTLFLEKPRPQFLKNAVLLSVACNY